MTEKERIPPIKRYRREETKSESDDEWNAVDDELIRSKFVAYIPIKERRKQKLVKLGRITELQADDDDMKNRAMVCVSTDSGASSATEDNEEGLVVPDTTDTNIDITKQELVRKEEEILAKSKDTSLLLQHSELKKIAEARQESEMDKQLKEEEKILRSVAENTALRSAAELAKGVQYVDPIKTSWKPPSRIVAKGDQRHHRVRKQQNIIIEGENLPPPLTTFADMKFNKGIMKGNL